VGFQRLAAAESLGRVGAVFMLEASRLARSSLHRLLEIAPDAHAHHRREHRV
jgi:hypothetical protein